MGKALEVWRVGRQRDGNGRGMGVRKEERECVCEWDGRVTRGGGEGWKEDGWERDWKKGRERERKRDGKGSGRGESEKEEG